MQREQLRTLVRGAYDIQKLRIQMGNRIVGNFKAKLGQEPGTKEEDIEEDARQVLADLRRRYKKLTDGVKTFPRKTSFEGDEVISTYTELSLMGMYVVLEKSEAEHFSRLGKILTDFPIWNEFLSSVKGVGPAMAGVIISEFDIHKAKYPSSLWAYAGLDVVGEWGLDSIVILEGDEASADEYVNDETKVPRQRPFLPEHDCQESVNLSETGYEMTCTHVTSEFKVAAIYGFKGPDGGWPGGRSRRREHLREIEYIDKDGKPATKLGITFNPFLKTKLTGVLGTSFLRVGDSPYAKMYYDYKHRVESHARYGVENDKTKDDEGHLVTSKLRRHNMAIRYMIKLFLIDLYKAWRALENLPVSPPYSEAKLGVVHAA
jgi:hypothetical protein